MQIKPSFAGQFPSRPIDYISPYPPGGTNDLVARVDSKRLQERLHASFIVENRSGAGGTRDTVNSMAINIIRLDG